MQKRKDTDPENVKESDTPRRKIIKIKRRRCDLSEGKSADAVGEGESVEAAGESKSVEVDSVTPAEFFSCLPPASAPPVCSNPIDGVGFSYPGVSVPPFIPEMSRIEDAYIHSVLHVPVVRETGYVRDETAERSDFIGEGNEPNETLKVMSGKVGSDQTKTIVQQSSSNIIKEPVRSIEKGCITAAEMSALSEKRMRSECSRSSVLKGPVRFLETETTPAVESGARLEEKCETGLSGRSRDQGADLQNVTERGSTRSPAVQVVSLYLKEQNTGCLKINCENFLRLFMSLNLFY